MAAEYEQFLLFGDSLTQGSASQERGFGLTPALQEAYIRRLDIINRGFNGYNTIQALKVLPKIVPSPDKAKIRLMTIFFGANDAASDEYVEGIPVQRVPLAQYKENLINIATDPCVQAHKPSLVIITPPPVDEYPMAISDKSRGFKEVKRTAERTKSYADAAKEVGKELGIPVLDAWTAFMKKAGWKEGDPLVGSQSVPRSPVFEMLMYDGLHLNPEAYRILFDELTELLAHEYPNQVPDKLPIVLPKWDDEAAWKI